MAHIHACDHINIKSTVSTNFVGIFYVVFVVLASAECMFDIELLVDDESWPSNEVLYKPVGSSGSFVTCQWCNDSSTGNPNWVSIPICDDKMPMICASRAGSGVRDLQFSSFMQAQAGSYTCRGNDDTQSIMIAVLSPPVITTYPTSQLATGSMSVTLNCEGTGRGSGETYRV